MKRQRPVTVLYERRPRRTQTAATISNPKKSPLSKARKVGTAQRAVRGRPGGASLPESQRAAFREWRASLPTHLERDTLLWPRAIAESVCYEVSRFLDEPLPDRYVIWLEAKTQRCYAAHRHFHKRLKSRGNLGRDWLYVYMRHWLASLLKLERPDLYYCLPENFGNGHRLPPGTHSRVRRNGFTDLLPAPRTWKAARVLRHPRWRWAA